MNGRPLRLDADQILGGIWGGMFHVESTGDHDQLEPDRTLLERGLETFHLGHGGPVTRDAFEQWGRSWPDKPC